MFSTKRQFLLFKGSSSHESSTFNCRGLAHFTGFRRGGLSVPWEGLAATKRLLALFLFSLFSFFFIFMWMKNGHTRFSLGEPLSQLCSMNARILSPSIPPPLSSPTLDALSLDKIISS